jgi:hypothetical protein
LALIVYAFNPPALFKWPLVFIFVSLGAGSAFIPFEGRPIDTWIFAFFKRIYSPTQYVWRQGGAVQSIPSINKEQTSQKNTFQSSIHPGIGFKPPTIHMPNLNIKNTVSLFSKKNEASPDEKEANPPKETQKEQKENQKPASQTIVLSRTPASPPAGPTKTFQAHTQQAVSTGTILKPPSLPKFSPPTQIIQPKVEAKFVPSAIIPATPTMSNLLVGFVHTPDGKIVENAILEVRDPQGTPVRAFKTNKLGQFRSATPLPNGSYEIETEKEGFRFDIIKVELKGEILSPIEIVSK